MTSVDVKYLGHSAWRIETNNYILVFDYGDTKRSGKALFRFSDEPKSKKILLFFSHSHHDHYDKKLHEQSLKYSNVAAVLGGFSKEYVSNFPNSAIINPYDIIGIEGFEGIQITAAKSTDEGVCFFVNVEGITIFFAGDHADWGDGDEANKIYYKEIDYIKNLGINVILAFIPVCTYDGKRPASIAKGAVYAMQTLDPHITLPMHANGREYLYTNFSNDFNVHSCTQKVFCMGEPGANFVLGNEETLQPHLEKHDEPIPIVHI